MDTDKFRILIVDDVPVNVMLLAGLLGESCIIHVAANGLDALRVAETQRPDLILLDVLMPEMDGFEVCIQLKANAHTREIPIIFVTAMSLDADIKKGLNLGAIDYITKPFNPPIVEARIKNHLVRSQIEKRNIDLFEQNQMLLQSVDEGICGVDIDGNTTFANPAAIAMVGWSLEELIGRSLHGRLHHSHTDGSKHTQEECPIYAALTYGTINQLKNEIFWRKDGSGFPAEYTSSPLRKGGELTGAVVIFRDVSHKSVLEERERHSQASRIAINALLETSLEPMSLEKQLHVALEIILSVYWIALEFKGAIFTVDPETEELVMRTQKGLADPLVSICKRIALGHCLCGLAAQTREIVFANRLDARHISLPDMHNHGHYCVPILSRGQLLGVLNLYLPCGHTQTSEELAFLTSIGFTLANIIEQRQLQDKLKSAQSLLQYAATHDALTNLPNRALFHERLGQGLLRARRNRYQLAVMFIDLDKFKCVNDSYGHKTGDDLLVQVAERIQSALRESDTVARMGGDEFTVILAEIHQKSDVIYVADKISTLLAKPFYIKGLECIIGSSIGISLFPDHGDSPEVLLKHADAVMYTVKSCGRNHYQFAAVEPSGT